MVESTRKTEEETEKVEQLGQKRLRKDLHEEQASMKRARECREEKEASENMPCAKRYERSYMHKDAISHILVSHRYDFVFTASTDGFLKFWKKAENGIEFVKTFRAHLTKISGMALS